jgi:Rrf2 family protein
MAEEDGRLSARELSIRYHIPAGILSKILQRLCHSGILISSQGPKGGYSLSRPSHDITLGLVIDAVHGPEKIVPCIEEPGACGQVETCTIKHSFETMQGMWVEFLNSMTLEQFAAMSTRQGELFPMAGGRASAS